MHCRSSPRKCKKIKRKKRKKRIWMQLSWVSLSQGLSQSQNQGISQASVISKVGMRRTCWGQALGPHWLLVGMGLRCPQGALYNIAAYKWQSEHFFPFMQPIFMQHFLFLNCFKVLLIYNVVPNSAIQQSDPVIHICIYIHTHRLIHRYIHSFSHIILHPVSAQEIGYSSLCHTVGPRCSSILNIIIYIY